MRGHSARFSNRTRRSRRFSASGSGSSGSVNKQTRLGDLLTFDRSDKCGSDELV
jgi:hypothetical protein